MPIHHRAICVSNREIGRVRQLVDAALHIHGGVTREYTQLLSRELQQAIVLPPSRLSPDVVTLRAKVAVTDMESGRSMAVRLVLPDQAGSDADQISILSPLGMALFGYKAGDCIEWGPVHRLIRVRIDSVKSRRRPPADARDTRPARSLTIRRPALTRR